MALRCDNKTGFTDVVENLCKDIGVRYKLRALYTKEQNSLAKKAGYLLTLKS